MTLFKKILMNYPNHAVLTSSWLKQQGISNDLQKIYRKNKWIYPIARGAFIKVDDTASLEGGVYALQQDGHAVHVGGKSALTQYHNVWQYLKKSPVLDLFCSQSTTLPKWFNDFFNTQYVYYNASFLSTKVGLEAYNTGNFSIQISSPERAFLELLYTCPKKISVQEAFEVMELLSTLRPKLLQELLMACTSIKVKRLFLYLASVAKHDWYEALDAEKINQGTAVYKIENGGQFIKEFNIVVKEVKHNV